MLVILFRESVSLPERLASISVLYCERSKESVLARGTWVILGVHAFEVLGSVPVLTSASLCLCYSCLFSLLLLAYFSFYLRSIFSLPSHVYLFPFPSFPRNEFVVLRNQPPSQYREMGHDIHSRCRIDSHRMTSSNYSTS